MCQITAYKTSKESYRHILHVFEIDYDYKVILAILNLLCHLLTINQHLQEMYPSELGILANMWIVGVQKK